MTAGSSRVLPDGGGGTIVGVAASDCVVLVADTRATRGTTVASERVEKLEQVHPQGVMGAPSSLGSAQSFLRVMRSLVEEYELERNRPIDLSSLATRAASELGMRPIEHPFVLGGVDEDGPQVYELDSAGGLLEVEAIALGSGQQIATGVLEGAPSLETLDRTDARELAVEALTAAVERDVETGVGLQLAEITADGVDIDRYKSAATALESLS